MTTTTLREFRLSMKSYLDELDENKDVLLIPRQGDKEAIVIMTLSEYNNIKETDYLLSSPNNRKMLEQSMSEIESGDTIEFKTRKV